MLFGSMHVERTKNKTMRGIDCEKQESNQNISHSQPKIYSQNATIQMDCTQTKEKETNAKTKTNRKEERKKKRKKKRKQTG